jgi:hypothetical protein
MDEVVRKTRSPWGWLCPQGLASKKLLEKNTKAFYLLPACLNSKGKAGSDRLLICFKHLPLNLTKSALPTKALCAHL